MFSAILAQSVLPHIDLGTPFADFINAITSWVIFNWVDTVINWLVDKITFVLTWPPSIAMIIIFGALAWLVRNWRFGLLSLFAFGLIDAMGYFEHTMQTLALVLVATVFAVAIGLPIGILAARNSKVSLVVRPVLDFMQTMPAFIYLLLAIFFFNIGTVPGVVSSLIFAMPPAVRLTELGIRQVDAEVVEAAEAFGAKPSEVLRQVQLPLAMPTIMAGVNQVIMLSLSMVVIAGLGGATGLGTDVVRGVQRLNLGLGFTSGLAVVILAIYLDRSTSALTSRSSSAAAA